MKRFTAVCMGILMAVSLTACAPTEKRPGAEETRPAPPPEVLEQQTEVDGALEKEQMVIEDAEPAYTVCIYTVRDDKSGLKQNMDAIDSNELDAQLLVDLMADYGVLADGAEVLEFEGSKGTLTFDLGGAFDPSDSLTVTAIANTLIQNYEADDLILKADGVQVGDEPLTFLKEYKEIK